MAVSRSATPVHFLDTVEGEVALFRGIALARPVGVHRHFHVLAITRSIKQETGQTVTVGDVWDKLASMYDLESLEDGDQDDEELAETDGPSEDVNYHSHKSFREEFSLPHEDFEYLIAPRRLDHSRKSESPRRPGTESPRIHTHARKQSAASNPASVKAALNDLVGFDSEGDLTEEDEAKAGRNRTEMTNDDSDDVDMASEGDDSASESPAASGAATRSGRSRPSVSAMTSVRGKKASTRGRGRPSAGGRSHKKVR